MNEDASTALRGEAALLEDAINRMRALRHSRDPEAAGVEADKILCQVLRKLVWGSLVTEWEAVERWYA